MNCPLLRRTDLPQRRTMERYIQIAGAVLTVAAFVPAIIFFIRAATHFVKMLPHIRSARHNVMANLGPL